MSVGGTALPTQGRLDRIEKTSNFSADERIAQVTFDAAHPLYLYRVEKRGPTEETERPLTQAARYLDKRIGELGRVRKMEGTLRQQDESATPGARPGGTSMQSDPHSGRARRR